VVVPHVRNPFETAARQSASLRVRDHRPWPLPTRVWLMGQTWERLLFAHWRLPHERVQSLVPAMPVDAFDGSAWIGVTPFVLTGLRLAGTPPPPLVSTFPEVNVRTYVTIDGKSGIYFFSLDAASSLAVAAARRFYRLPYFRARMRIGDDDGWVRYESRRLSGPPAELRCRYRAAGTVRRARPGTMEHFLTERYCLYTLGPEGGIHRAEIHHPPWPLQRAEADFELNTMAPAGLALPPEEPVLHFAARQDVVIWPLQRI
jgi:uncharacterized protein YqjF (DUF2071 family)